MPNVSWYYACLQTWNGPRGSDFLDLLKLLDICNSFLDGEIGYLERSVEYMTVVVCIEVRSDVIRNFADL